MRAAPASTSARSTWFRRDTARSRGRPTGSSGTSGRLAFTTERGYRLEAADKDTAESFDDLSGGRREGGASRKQRRGEELTHEDKQPLGGWQRLSTARKAAAIR